jgi:type I pantothenate kinase
MTDALSLAFESLVAAIVVATKEGRTIVALDGPVAVGKSTLAAWLAGRLEASGLTTSVVGADGFLLPLAKLREEGLIARKGAPESFDRAAIVAFLTGYLRGEEPSAPVYAHDLYDVSPERRTETKGADVVIFEGVNVLDPYLAPLYDFLVYLDADPADLEVWFTARFVATPFSAARAEALSPWRPADGDLARWAAAVWREVNLRNLVDHISKGRDLADIVLFARSDHSLV